MKGSPLNVLIRKPSTIKHLNVISASHKGSNLHTSSPLNMASRPKIAFKIGLYPLIHLPRIGTHTDTNHEVVQVALAAPWPSIL